jgi:hypothetical protein
MTQTYWAAWPLFKPAEEFPTKTEAREYVASNGGGEIRKFKWNGSSPSTRMDSIEIAAR